MILTKCALTKITNVKLLLERIDVACLSTHSSLIVALYYIISPCLCLQPPSLLFFLVTGHGWACDSGESPQ